MRHPLCSGARFPGLGVPGAFTAQAFAAPQHLLLSIVRAEALVFHV